MEDQPLEVTFDGRSANVYEWANVDDLNYPCHEYHDKSRNENTVACTTQENPNMRLLKQLVETEKKREMASNPAEVIAELIDQADLMMDLRTDVRLESNTSDLSDDEYKDIREQIKQVAAKFEKGKDEPEEALDIPLVAEIINRLQNMKEKRAEFAMLYLNEAKTRVENFTSMVFTLDMQNRQGTKEFVTEFTKKMIEKGYDPRSANGKLELTCEMKNGKKSTFAYQIPVPAIVRPENPDVSKMLVLHRTGAGKTITILKTVNNFFFDLRPKFIMFPKSNVRDNFYKELMTNPASWNLFQTFAVERLFSYMYREGSKNFKEVAAKLQKFYENGMVESDEDLIAKVYTTDKLGRLGKRVKTAVVNVLAGEDLMWMKSYSNTGVKQKCGSDGIYRLDVYGKKKGCIMNFPWAPLRALSFTQAGSEAYSSANPKSGSLKAITKLPKFNKDGSKRDFVQMGVGAPGDPAETNIFGCSSVMILDEVHVLVKPSQVDYTTEQIKYSFPKLIKRLRQAQNSVVVAFTATPITSEQSEGEELMKMVKGNENIDMDTYGFVSYMNTAPEAIYPRVTPGEISLGTVHCCEIKGNNAKVYREKHNASKDLNPSQERAYERSIARLQNYANCDIYCGQLRQQQDFVSEIKKVKSYEKLQEFAQLRCSKLLKICQNIMSEREKTLVLIEEKMGMFPLAELLKRMVELCGENCYPKYCDDNRDGGCFIEMWKSSEPQLVPKLKFKGVRDTEAHNEGVLNAFNSQDDNLKGEKIMCIIADARAFTESTSFGQVRKLILANPALAWSTHKQRIGRVLRACIYSRLPSQDRTVRILTFVSRLQGTDTADEMAIKKLADDMFKIEKWMKEMFEEYAIDKELLKPLIGEVPQPIRDQDSNNCNTYEKM